MEDVVFAFRFFTNIPFPGENLWRERQAARALGWLPLTGLVIGLAQAAMYLFMAYWGFPRGEAARSVLLILTELFLGGTLFLDGFSDCCDGLFSRRDREGALRIMKDSRIGAMGVVGLILYFLLKFAFYQELGGGQEDFLRVLVYSPVLARFAVSLTACLFPAAKEEGLASFFKKEQQPGDLLLAAVFAAALGLWLPGYLRLAGLLALAGAYGAGALINRRLAGHTGDTYGFASLMSEQMFLFFAVLIGFIRWMY